ncbi:MAG: RNA polymerase sigma factor [Dehalococcoidia bacterium]
MSESTSELARAGLFSPFVHADADSERIHALRARESAAWTALFEQQKDVVFRSALSLVGERELAEDITGQVFLEAIEGIGRFRDRGVPLTAWLLAIARHRSIDAMRKRRRERNTGVPPAESGAFTANPALSALGQLTPEQREIIHLRFVEDLPIEEVARLTRRSPGAVKSLQHRALRQLRSQLAHRGPEHA